MTIEPEHFAILIVLMVPAAALSGAAITALLNRKDKGQ